MNDSAQQHFTPDTENLGINQLNDIGNQAIKQGLIAGHGHHQGQYEIIHKGKILTMSPKEALTFLQQLTQGSEVIQNLPQNNGPSGHKRNVDQPEIEA